MASRADSLKLASGRHTRPGILSRLALGLAAPALLLLSGCGLSKGPGVAPASNFGPSISLGELVHRSGDYNVYVFTSPRPSLMLFDPKDDDWSFRVLDQPVLYTKQPTAPEVIANYADDLRDRLSYPKKYVLAVTVKDVAGNEQPAGYVYLENPAQLSMRYDKDTPNTVVVVRVLELDRFKRELIHEDDD